jgi:hypothetical protein
MRKDWHGLVKVLEIIHRDAEGRVLWRDENLYNLLHSEGEDFLLRALFLGGNSPSTYIPASYYFGLDDRTVIGLNDTMVTVADGNEPTVNGYARQAVSSSGQFNIVTVSSVHQANSPILSFHASGGSWGPVHNLFLTDDAGYAGKLIASVPLSQSLTVNDGETISMRMGLALRDCPS